ncbi:MAG: glycosyltransferase family 4 protein [Chloroflexota bacterium]
MAAGGDRVRVLVIHPRDPVAPTVGGIQTFLADFIKYAPPEFEITFAGTTADRAARPIGRKTRVTVSGRTATVLPLAAAGGLPRDPLGLFAAVIAQLRLRAEMVRGGRILQVHRPYRSVYLTGHRGPRVQFVHVDIRDWPGPSAWGQLRGMYRQFSDRALGAMARIFVVNEPGAEILRRDHPSLAERVDFLPVWYDPQTFHPPADDGERAELRRAVLSELGVEGETDDALVLFAGRLEPIKDPEMALTGWAAYVGAGRAARLVVCGSGELRPALEKQAERLGLADRVHFLGDVPRSRLARIMRATDVLLLTSRAEGGGPRVVLEALASAMPVVATPVGEVRRTVAHQVDGYLLEETSAESVAAGLEWVLAAPRGPLNAAAVAAAAPYTAQAVLARVYETYRGLMNGAAR